MGEETFQDNCNRLRGEIKSIDSELKGFSEDIKEAPDENFSEEEDKGEMIANLILAHRHLEDARMRLGKAIQYSQGGVSVYDQNA